MNENPLLSNDNIPLLGIVMIVKNETDIIEECLKSIYNIIDTFCIVDTGSSDDTKEKIINFFNEHKIEGNLYESTWKDFSTNRSEALSLTKGKMKYAWMIDADDYVEGKWDDLREFLEKKNPSAISLPVSYSNISFVKTCIFNTNDNWKYKYRIHEVCYNDNKNLYAVRFNPSSGKYILRSAGARSKDENRFRNDLDLLLKDHCDNKDDTRTVFYIANTFRDMGNKERAEQWYNKRIRMNYGYKDEIYYSLYMISRYERTEDSAWKAHEFDITRVESLYHYVYYCRKNNINLIRAYAMALYAVNIPKPSGKLFVEDHIYDSLLKRELELLSILIDKKNNHPLISGINDKGNIISILKNLKFNK